MATPQTTIPVDVALCISLICLTANITTHHHTQDTTTIMGPPIMTRTMGITGPIMGIKCFISSPLFFLEFVV
ncbi:hypothetical protein TcasGA2_TC034148 [Tribolium castaneum]|uniref:Uncharacterized protein n=1 Tax=Tribolium castaneum TaxID=7070 RepID=A0A139WD01_TRICA|nr:hypothetical protein TcasGA2_TC034148 [Tribolium castaneum]